MVIGESWFGSSRGLWWDFACPFSFVAAEEEFLALLEVVPEADAHP
jgi:hypothetical protein